MRTLSIAIGAILTCAWGLACSSSTQNVTGPSTSKCQVTAVADPARFGSSGGNGTLTVTTNRECSWNATSGDGWLKLAGESSVQGSGKVGFVVASNADPSQRRGAIAVGDQQVAIHQDAAACTFTVPSTDTVSSDGERRTLNISANGPECAWTARTDTDWLTILQGAQGKGTGQVVYEARATKGPVRSGELTIAGQRVAVIQGAGCSMTISPGSHTISAAGGTGSVMLTTDAGCPWSAQSETSWIAISSATSGVGPATVAFRVDAWEGPARTGTLRVGAQVVTVRQNSGCRVGINPESFSAEHTGGSGSTTVTTAAGCEWAATSGAPWITITSGGSGSGNGTVQFALAANKGPARSGALNVGGRNLAVTQSSGCSYGISPESFAVAATGGTSAIAVTTTAECDWTASSSVPWIGITSGGSGSGNGTVQFSVAATTGPARAGTLSIAGRPFTVSQSSGCTFSISPTSQSVSHYGAAGSVGVATSAGCPWNAASAIPWVHITAGQSGSGPGTVVFAADQSQSSLPRSASFTIAGQPFTVNQEGAPCAFVLSPGSASIGSGGGSGTFEVNTPEACTWTASSSDGWLHVVAGGSGSGDGTVTFSADANPGPARSATIAVGGKIFTATQAGAGGIRD